MNLKLFQVSLERAYSFGYALGRKRDFNTFDNLFTSGFNEAMFNDNFCGETIQVDINNKEAPEAFFIFSSFSDFCCLDITSLFHNSKNVLTIGFEFDKLVLLIREKWRFPIS